MLLAIRNPLNVRPWKAEQRRALRRAVRLKAALRQVGLPQFSVDLEDFSIDGFRAQTAVALSPGSRVWLTLPTFRALEAVVAWRDGGRCGCRFREPLHVAVLDYIIRRDRQRAA